MSTREPEKHEDPTDPKPICIPQVNPSAAGLPVEGVRPFGIWRVADFEAYTPLTGPPKLLQGK
jgi:hypothetical protein